MRHAIPGDTGRVHCTGAPAAGTVLDSAAQREPIEFAIGEGRVILGFE
jgi:peptidylprolyl isomerase